MKKIVNVLVLTLAMNFLLAAGGVAMLFQSGRLDRTKVAEIRKMLNPSTQPTAVAVKTAPATQPADRLELLVAKASGRPPAEQVDFIRQTFATEMAELDRRKRDLQDLAAQIQLAQAQAKADHDKVDAAQKAVDDQASQAKKDADAKGFKDSLALYSIMPAKQVKTIWMTLSDDTIEQYLRAMQPRTAAKIIKEFKQPEETARVQKVLEKIRQSQPAVPATTPAGQSAQLSP